MKIIGICLIKNEDLYIETVIRNVLNFCDELIVLENNSQDETFAIVKGLSVQYPKIKLIQIEEPSDTHRFVVPYVGTDTWVFRVDGDEVYDPDGLKRLREELFQGKYKDWWAITSATVNVATLDLSKKEAVGYKARMSALNNFSLLVRWDEGKAERLHGVNKVFKDFFDPKKMKLIIPETEDFETSYFRCLHLCFIQRSSVFQETKRKNPGEKKKWKSFLFNAFKNVVKGTIVNGVSYKDHVYRIGRKQCFNISIFFLE